MLVKTLILEMSESRLPNPKNWIIAKSRFFVPGKNGSKPKRTYGVPVATRTYGIYRSSFCRTCGVYS